MSLGLDKTPQEQFELDKVAKQANNVFIASIISILFCCLGGAIATYFAHQAKQDVMAENIDGAKRHINIAMGLMIASFVIGGLSLLAKLAGPRY
jgi:hypothetical protein